MNRDIFFQHIRLDPFSGKMTQSQVAGINTLLAVWNEALDPRWLAYTLATVFHETRARMQPVREGNGKTDAAARRAVNKLAKERGPDSAVAEYAAPDPVTGHVYYGRGYDQLTFKRNYERMGEALGLDLVNNPDLMLEPDVAARSIMLGMTNGLYTGKKLSNYFNARVDNPLQARRIVNGMDRAGWVAGYHAAFLAAILAANGEEVKPEPVERETAPPRYPEEAKPLSKSKTIKAQGLVGTGTVGATGTEMVADTLNQAQDAASQLSMYLDIAKWLFVLLIFLGIAWTVYERVKAYNEGRR